MILLLQRHSILQLLFHLDIFFRAETIHIYGQERRFSILDAFGISARMGKRALAALGLAHKVQPLDSELFSPTLWEANYEAITLAEGCSDDFKSAATYRFLLALLGEDSALIKYYEARFALYISRLLHLTKIAEVLAKTKDIRVVVGHEEFADLRHSPRLLQRIVRFRTRRSQMMAAVTRRLSGVCYRLQWLALPLLRLITLLPRFRVREISPKPYKLMMQVHWGTSSEMSNDGDEVRTPKDDFYLYSERLGPGDILHYYDGSWRFDADFRNRCNTFMEEKGYAWSDRADLWMTPRYARHLLAIQRRLLKHALQSGLLLKESPAVQNVSARGLWEILERGFDLEHFRWGAVFDRTDYNPRHIIDTILLNRYGCKTVGLHHCASPYDSPQIAFVHYNHYVALGEMFARPYERWWDPTMVVRIGRNNLDWAVRPKIDGHAEGDLLERFERAHGTFRHRVTVVLPGDVYYMFPQRWREIEEGLRRFIESDLDMAVIVRFKTREGIQKSQNLRRLWDLCQTDLRVVVDSPGFSSYELMAISHMVIAPNCSSAINEAIGLDIPVFTFDFHGRAPLVFTDYGKDFVLTSGAELFDRFRSLPHGFGQYDLHLERLNNEANYTCDGHNHERTRKFISAVALGENVSPEYARVVLS
jgi:hypothetical protein